MTERLAGSILDGLGVELDLDDDDLVIEATVIAKVSLMSDGGGTTIVIGNSKGIDWVSQLGLIEAARRVVHAGMEEAE